MSRKTSRKDIEAVHKTFSDFQDQHGYIPTMREVSEITGFSLNKVWRHCQILTDEKKLQVIGKKIVLLKEEDEQSS